jgi:hypothetical protein
MLTMLFKYILNGRCLEGKMLLGGRRKISFSNLRATFTQWR